VWSSRENIRAQLLSLLQTLPPEERRPRYGAVGLLGLFGGPEQLPLLRGLVLDPSEDFTLRHRAMSSGHRLGLRLSGPALTGLLEGLSDFYCGGHSHTGPCSPPMELFLALAETDADHAAVRAVFPPPRATEAPEASPPEAPPRHLRRIVRDQSLYHRLCRYPCIKPAPEFSWAVEQLCTRRETRPLLYQFLCDFDVAAEVRDVLLQRLFTEDRAVAARWVAAAWTYPENLPVVRGFLARASLEPRPEERPLFLAALRGPDDLARCFAIEGLRALGESGAGWCDRLTSLAHASHPAVRLRAAAGLVRQGRREWLPLLRQTALEAEQAPLRAEALRWLGELDGEASRSVLKQALLKMERPSLPAADEAVWALSRLGSAEDLSALLDAALFGLYTPRLERALEHHLARQEGRPAPDVPPVPHRYMAELSEEPLRAGPGTGAGPASARG
jgi:HEAT repeat protein